MSADVKIRHTQKKLFSKTALANSDLGNGLQVTVTGRKPFYREAQYTVQVDDLAPLNNRKRESDCFIADRLFSSSGTKSEVISSVASVDNNLDRGLIPSIMLAIHATAREICDRSYVKVKL